MWAAREPARACRSRDSCGANFQVSEANDAHGVPCHPPVIPSPPGPSAAEQGPPPSRIRESFLDKYLKQRASSQPVEILTPFLVKEMQKKLKKRVSSSFQV